MEMSIIVIVLARSISEEFSSGDQGRLRDEEYGSKAECSSSHRNEGSHKSDNVKDPKKDKDKEEKDEGMCVLEQTHNNDQDKRNLN